MSRINKWKQIWQNLILFGSHQAYQVRQTHFIWDKGSQNDKKINQAKYWGNEVVTKTTQQSPTTNE